MLLMTRILIADDHAVVRSGVRSVIESHPGWTVVAEAADGKDAIAQAIATSPTWPSSPIGCPCSTASGHAPNPTACAKRRGPHLHHARQREPDTSIVQRWRARLRAEVRRPAAVDFGHPVAGRAQAFFTDSASQVLLETFLTGKSRVERALTGREHTIVQLVAEGHSNKQIAQILNITIKTVETHRAASCASSTWARWRHWCATPFATN